MRPLLLPFSPRYILLTIALAGAAAFAAAAWRAPSNLPYLLMPLAFFGAFVVLGIRDLTQTQACDIAQLSDRGAPAVHFREHPPGDAPVLLRVR